MLVLFLKRVIDTRYNRCYFMARQGSLPFVDGVNDMGFPKVWIEEVWDEEELNDNEYAKKVADKLKREVGAIVYTDLDMTYDEYIKVVDYYTEFGEWFKEALIDTYKKVVQGNNKGLYIGGDLNE